MYRKFLAISLVTSLCFYGCGTILKEEQINQPHSGKLDWKIVLLDGIGLIFFIVPGVVSYAVDYSNGTLFLSKDETMSLNGNSEGEILRALERATGRRIAPEQIVELSLEEARERQEFRKFFLAERDL